MTPTPGFDRWWAAWPRNVNGGYQRKGGKSECLKIWLKCHHETQADTIVAHVEWLKTTADWLKDRGAYIPMPVTYLRQQRWDGADIPGTPAAQEHPAERVQDSADVMSTRALLAQQEADRQEARAAWLRRKAAQGKT